MWKNAYNTWDSQAVSDPSSVTDQLMYFKKLLCFFVALEKKKYVD